MKKIITAINNPIINEKLKKEKIEVIGKDIQYKEGILEILENNKEINFILIDEKLPGEIKNDELINKIKKINKNIEIIFFIKKENKKNAIINEKKIIKDEKIKSKIKIVDYEKEIKIESFLYLENLKLCFLKCCLKMVGMLIWCLIPLIIITINAGKYSIYIWIIDCCIIFALIVKISLEYHKFCNIKRQLNLQKKNKNGFVNY